MEDPRMKGSLPKRRLAIHSKQLSRYFMLSATDLGKN